ncbi:MAG: hypothetical protein GWN16_10540, partial [Calditrichae bacterium]|nr:hypothetical protein [Calditrichia bacterium]
MNASDSTNVTVDFPLSLNRSSYDLFVRATVDASEDVEDFNPANNTRNQQLTPTVYNITPATGSDTISVASVIKIHFPPGSVSDSTAVKIEVRPFDKPKDQTALKPVSLMNTSQIQLLEVRVLNSQADLITPFNLEIDLDSSLVDTNQYSIENIKLYEKTTQSRPWVVINSSVNAENLKLLASPQKSAMFAPFISDDSKPPQIELTVDGRPLQESGLVSEKPSLYVIVQDEGGIDFDKEKIELLLDDQPLAEDKFFIPDSLQKK